MQRRLSATALLYSSCVCLFSVCVFLCEGIDAALRLTTIFSMRIWSFPPVCDDEFLFRLV